VRVACFHACGRPTCVSPIGTSGRKPIRRDVPRFVEHRRRRMRGHLWSGRVSHVMETKHIRQLPVMDEKKKMVGMLSLGDLLHAASQKTAAETLKAVSGHHA
jgi:CBS domain